MERLTAKHYLGTGHYMKCSGNCNVDMDCIDCPSFDCLVERLAAYEGTGLEPESCAEFAQADAEGRYIVMRDAEQEGVARLRELAKADKDGRLVVLPCKVGDPVYLIVTKRARNHTPEFRFVKKSRLTFLNMERILQDFGKEAFLTREEADEALEAMK